MIIDCVWEHNGNDTLLYAENLPGAYTRGECLETAMLKMPAEVRSFLKWKCTAEPKTIDIKIVQEAVCDLNICDADSDVLFNAEKAPLTAKEYDELKKLSLKSAADFLMLYNAVSNKTESTLPIRKTFYGQAPRTAEEMYIHTKNVNEYYFGEIEVNADNEGTILDCRRNGFKALEQKADFLANNMITGSFGEAWTLRKVLRRFIWHDRIHAKAMYRMSKNLLENKTLPDVFHFKELI